MTKIFINEAKESWIVDRFRQEFINNFPNLCTNRIQEADIVWIIAPWTWKKISKKHLNEKKVLCTVHHLEEKELEGAYLKDFKKRDFYVDSYHIISKKTKKKLTLMSGKKQIYAPFWINQENYFYMSGKNDLREKYSFKQDDFLVGSFQRDSEGKNVNQPKLIKGPDRFLEIIRYYWEVQDEKNLKVVLTGYRRDYLIHELTKHNIPFKYFEKTDLKSLNELYNILDLYIVSSRTEGGPQSIVEAAITKTPIISTDVGIASEILDETSIFNMDNFRDAKPNVQFAFNSVQKLLMPEQLTNFKAIFKDLVN